MVAVSGNGNFLLIVGSGCSVTYNGKKNTGMVSVKVDDNGNKVVTFDNKRESTTTKCVKTGQIGKVKKSTSDSIVRVYKQKRNGKKNKERLNQIVTDIRSGENQ